MELVPEDRSYTIRISRKYSDDSRNYFNLNEVTDEQFQELLDTNTFVDEEYGVTAKAEKYEHSQIPFFKIKLNTTPKASSTEVITVLPSRGT